MRNYTVDNNKVEELIMVFCNDASLYHQFIWYACRNLASKKRHNTYKEELAPKIFMPAVIEGLKDYNKKYDNEKAWYLVANTKERALICKGLLDFHRDLIDDFVNDVPSKP